MSNKAKATLGEKLYRTQIQTDDHHFIADEPMDLGGGDLGPNPGEFISAALASCSTITMKMYANRKGWNLQEAIVEVDFERDIKTNTTTFTKKIELKGNLDEEQRKRLFEIASRCPIHRILENPSEIKSELF